MNRKYKSVKEIKEIVDKYNELKEWCERFITVDDYFDEFDCIEFGSKTLDLCYEYFDGYSTEYHSKCVPIEWLLLNKEELRKAIKEKEEKDRIEAEERETHMKQVEKELEEAREKAEYERLKAKFER